MIVTDEWILNYMRTACDEMRTCPDAATAFMQENGIRYSEYQHNHLKTMINRKMKILERYGMVRYTGRIVSSNIRSKIWEVVE